MFLKSVARQLPGTPPVSRLAPQQLGLGNSLRHSGNSSFILPLRRPWAVRFFSFVLGSLLKGFFAPVHLYVGFLGVWLSYAFLPMSLGCWLVCGWAHTIGSWEYGFWSSCLIAFLWVGDICLSHDEVKRAVGLFL